MSKTIKSNYNVSYFYNDIYKIENIVSNNDLNIANYNLVIIFRGKRLVTKLLVSKPAIDTA
jgi:hypothetical protein